MKDLTSSSDAEKRLRNVFQGHCFNSTASIENELSLVMNSSYDEGVEGVYFPGMTRDQE